MVKVQCNVEYSWVQGKLKLSHSTHTPGTSEMMQKQVSTSLLLLKSFVHKTLVTQGYMFTEVLSALTS